MVKVSGEMPGIWLGSADVLVTCVGVLPHKSGFLFKGILEVVPSLTDVLDFRKSTSGDVGASDDFSWPGPDKVVASSALTLTAASLLEDAGSFNTAVTDTSLSPSFGSFVNSSPLLPDSLSLLVTEVLADFREKVKEAEISFLLPSDVV